MDSFRPREYKWAVINGAVLSDMAARLDVHYSLEKHTHTHTHTHARTHTPCFNRSVSSLSSSWSVMLSPLLSWIRQKYIYIMIRPHFVYCFNSAVSSLASSWSVMLSSLLSWIRQKYIYIMIRPHFVYCFNSAVSSLAPSWSVMFIITVVMDTPLFGYHILKQSFGLTSRGL